MNTKGQRRELRGGRRCKPSLRREGTVGDTAEVGEGQHHSVNIVPGLETVGDHPHTHAGRV